MRGKSSKRPLDRSARRLVRGLAGAATLGLCPLCQGADVFGTYRDVPPTPAGSQLGQGTICVFGALSSPLPLREAVERALCSNPKSAQAWASIKQQAAAVGIGRAAYLPSVNTTVQKLRQGNLTNVSAHPELSVASKANVLNATASLSWTRSGDLCCGP